jgi:hypothetical protein
MMLDVAIYFIGTISLCLTIYECISSSSEDDKYDNIDE